MKPHPKLGAMYVDMDSQVDSLHINNGEHIAAFLMREVVVETGWEMVEYQFV